MILQCSYSYKRQLVSEILKATQHGTPSFEAMAAHHNSGIFTGGYTAMHAIVESTLAGRYGRTIITEQNLQYYPHKIRYYYCGPLKDVVVTQDMCKGDIMTLAYGGRYTNVDCALPQDLVNLYNLHTFHYVMDYSGANRMGEVRHLKEVAASKGLNLIYDYDLKEAAGGRRYKW